MTSRTIGGAVLLLMALVGLPQSAAAQATATVIVPIGVNFNVADVTTSTRGVPDPVQVGFTSCSGIQGNQSLVISVRADTSTFAGPGSVHPAASAVSWTATTASGTASSGTLSSSAYTQVYRRNNPCAGSRSGSASLTWTLGAVTAPGLRSGTHTLTIRWKFEAF